MMAMTFDVFAEDNYIHDDEVNFSVCRNMFREPRDKCLLDQSEKLRTVKIRVVNDKGEGIFSLITVERVSEVAGVRFFLSGVYRQTNGEAVVSVHPFVYRINIKSVSGTSNEDDGRYKETTIEIDFSKEDGKTIDVVLYAKKLY